MASEKLWHAAQNVRRAIIVPGPQPEYHYRMLRKHQNEWPMLWEAIGELLTVLEEN